MWFRGTRASIATPHPKDIRSFDELVDLFFTHLRLLYSKQVDGMIGGFGHMGSICPSPLLSSFVEGCLEKGLDIYDGGATYNVIAPCFTAPSTTINSLYAIKKMVFDPDTAVTSLPELVEALICDWGNKMVEPFVSTLAGPARIEARAERFRRLREIALAQPRYGRGHPEIDELGNAIVRRVAETAVTIFTDPVPSTAQKMLANAERIGTVEQPFGGFQIQPGVGTFENYLEFGAQWGASADGRRLGDPMASDLSPSPVPSDLPPEHQPADLVEVLAGYTGSGTDALWDGAPTDLNIREDFPVDDLVRGLEMFAKGAGSNVLTITCADPETFAGAESDPEKYDVVRVRMGGWSEFFVAMFPGHQEQHRRRPLNTPGHPSEIHAP
jgi:pyruvate-formate lyase